MVKLIALYRHPEDKKAFDDHYWNVHAPLAEKMPGLKKLEVTRLVGTPMGGELALLEELNGSPQATHKASLVAGDDHVLGDQLADRAGADQPELVGGAGGGDVQEVA